MIESLFGVLPDLLKGQDNGLSDLLKNPPELNNLPDFSKLIAESYNNKVRVCLEKSTGKLIEMQSHAKHETLILNAVNAGYNEEDVEVIEESQEEFNVRFSAIPKEPQPKSQTEILQEQIQTLTLTIANLMLEGGV